ncbi:MAG: hypothetical protein HUJ75_07615 [Parasporobacterium sp.]|nr:hypothetical protein [Parasporobacterium sp.]
MLNPKKVELMTRISLFEKSEGIRALKLNKYHKLDLKRSVGLRSIPLGIITYLILVGILILMDADWMTKLYNSLEVWSSLLIVIGAGVIFVLLYRWMSIAIMTRHYEDTRNSVKSYSLNLRRLEKMYSKEEK